MRRFKVIFYKPKLNNDGSMTRLDLKTFWVYADNFDKADRFTQKKLVEFQDKINDTKVTYWIEAIGTRVFDIPYSK